MAGRRGSADADSGEPPMRRSRAVTLLKTTTMQKVAWPTMIVKRPALMPKTGLSTFWMTDWSAIPVTMPGSAIGRITSSEIELRPKNLYRVSASASRLASTRAIAVAPSPASTDVRRASRGPGALSATDHHLVVRPGGGQPNVRSELNELIATTPNGM